MKKIMKNGKINGLLDVYGIIYLVKNKVNGKCYIGQTMKKNGFRDRYGVKYGQSLIESLYMARKKTMDNKEEYKKEILNKRDILLQDMEKYGLDAFEVNECIDYAFSRQELDIKEKTYIKYYKSLIKENGYNKTAGGQGLQAFVGQDEISRELWKNEEFRNKTTNAIIAATTTEEHREKMRKIMTELWKDEEFRNKTINAIIAATTTEEYREKMRKITIELWKNEEYRNKVTSSVIKKVSAEEYKEKRRKIAIELWKDEEYRDKVVNSIIKSWENEDRRKEQSKRSKEMWNNEEKRKEIIENMLEAWKNQELKESFSKRIKEVMQDEEIRKKLSDSAKKEWQQDGFKEKMSNKQKKIWENEDLKKKQSAIQKEIQNRPDVKKKTLKKGSNNGTSCPVVCITGVEKNMTRKVFQCINEAVRWLKENNIIGSSHISDCCSGSRRYSGRCPDGTQLKWRYLIDLRNEELQNLLMSANLIEEEKEIINKQLEERKNTLNISYSTNSAFSTSNNINKFKKSVVCITGIKNNYNKKVFLYSSAAEKWMRDNNLVGANRGGISLCCKGGKEFQGYGIDGEKLEWKYLKNLTKEEFKELLDKDLTEEEKEIIQKGLAKN